MPTKKETKDNTEILMDIKKMISKMDNKLSQVEQNRLQLEDIKKRIVSIERTQSPTNDDEILLETNTSSFNPWLEGSLKKLHQIESKKYVEQSRETLKSTIAALAGAQKGLDAEAVSKITGKERNTESYYLNKLSRMGLVNKTRRRRKVYYKINKGMNEKLRSMFQ